MIKKSTEHDCNGLIKMYCEFEPKEHFQGIPPSSHNKIAEWVNKFFDDSFNVVAVYKDRIAGHASLLEVKEDELCEFLIFVHQNFQDCGIGTNLTDISKLCAVEYGYKSLWLCVELYNPRAIHVYSKAGFKFISPVEPEREMVLDLNLSEE